jgi:Nif-specific regulatory protein
MAVESHPKAGSRDAARRNDADSLQLAAHHLAALYDINQALTATPNLRAALRRMLEILEREQDVIRGTVILTGDDNGELRVEAAHGSGQRRLPCPAEPITRRVLDSGRPVIVPQISREPMFSSEAGDGLKRDGSFICVPVLLKNIATGAIAVDLSFKPDRDYDALVGFIRVVASMLAQAIKVDRLVDTERQRLLEENIHLRGELRERYDFSHIVGNSGPMRQVYEQVTQVAGTNTTVLIRGESGTGKELIAHAIHYNSPRAAKPFVKVSCAALPDSLLESELFGFEKGAFTGAHARKKGRFELADGGTLFLDEVGDLPMTTQVKLLRVIQEREFERVGGVEPVKVNVRLITATNKDLEKSIAAGTFREDLHYRLNVFAIFVPPLRQRKPDVMLLAEHFLEKYSSEHHKPIKRISTPAIDMLMSYHWPGNVRELQNVVERAVLVCDSNVVHGHHLPPTLQTAEASGTVTDLSLIESVDAYEKDLILDALKTSRGNRTKAAKLLHSTERIISYKVRKYRIDCRRFRS